MARSVVVPPMSTAIISGRPDRRMAPVTLLAGPESRVSTGYSAAKASVIKLPSPRTIISGAEMPFCAITARTAFISSLISGVSRALSKVVAARRMELISTVSSWAAATGSSNSALSRFFNSFSNSGLRTPQYSQMPKASTVSATWRAWRTSAS